MAGDAFAIWQAEIAKADEWLDALDEADLGHKVPLDDGTAALRDVLVHVIEEYARHVGHADLLVECIDGRTRQRLTGAAGNIRTRLGPI